MKILGIEVENLFGSLTRAIKFDMKLNLLVGINGSGKTSILNCIDWMLRPDLARLATMPFDSIRLEFEHEGQVYELLAVQEENRLIVSERSGILKCKPITVDFLRPPNALSSDQDVVETIKIYRGLRPESHERKLWQFLAELPQPLTITLDRTIAAEADDQIFLEGSTRLRVPKSQAKSPIEKVSEVTRERYAAYRERIVALNDELKAKLVISAFRDPLSISRGTTGKNISLTEISKLEIKVTSLLSASLGEDTAASRNIEKYFSEAKRFAKSAKKNKRMLPYFWTRFKQIADLAKAFGEFEQQSSEVYENLRSYLEALNSFFFESKKCVGFSDHDGALSFQFLGASGKPSGPYRSITNLSSGERQILVLITFLAFVSSSGKVFVVDEPELSLHPRWQENFLDALVGQSPLNTQIILATHSPEIVGKHRDKCIVLDAG